MAQLMPLPLNVSCFSRIQTDFTFLVRLTWVVPDKGPLNGCLCVAWRCELELTKRAALSAYLGENVAGFPTGSSAVFSYQTPSDANHSGVLSPLSTVLPPSLPVDSRLLHRCTGWVKKLSCCTAVGISKARQ